MAVVRHEDTSRRRLAWLDQLNNRSVGQPAHVLQQRSHRVQLRLPADDRLLRPTHSERQQPLAARHRVPP